MGVKDQARLFDQKSQNLTQGDRRIQSGLAQTQGSKRQRLDPAGLKAAKCDASKNPGVRALWDAVEDYNRSWKHPSTRQPPEIARAIACLDYIYYQCAEYMTDNVYKTLNSKGGTARRKQRYEAFERLLQEVATELESYGGKTLVGPAKFNQAGKRNYWLERLDPKNRAGYMISTKYDKWLQVGVDGQSFWQWLKLNGTTVLQDGSTHRIKDLSRVNGYNNPNSAQWQHCKHFSGGALNNANDTPFSTALLRTEFSSAGWAVWVCSLLMHDESYSRLGHHIFSNTHRAGWDHHSSFLGGAPVLAAGEWVVDNNGRIKVITGKSGHYMPKWENLHRFVVQFQQIPGNAIIRPNMLDHANGTSTIKFYRVSDFRSFSLGATPLKRAIVLPIIAPANSNITEHLPGGVTKTLSELLPP